MLSQVLFVCVLLLVRVNSSVPANLRTDLGDTIPDFSQVGYLSGADLPSEATVGGRMLELAHEAGVRQPFLVELRVHTNCVCVVVVLC